ncbi:MAG: hypothetical protein UR83_C0069G0004 [Candidatus Moranbacteria bacterium GW2011_GWF2_35_54]|nr:MAG: hypothetical protein UR83_C0069G0004 [Candidatus Moranbacteria bacterium GW2011_GWF2_35_54]
MKILIKLILPLFLLTGLFGSRLAHAQICTVSSLADSGAGTLRECVSLSDTEVEFAVGGTIVLNSVIVIDDNNISIDATTAPTAITISGYGLEIKSKVADNSSSVSNITIKGLRFQNPTNYFDSIWVWRNAHDVLIENCSFDGNTDGQVDVTEGAHDVEIRHNIFTNYGVGSGASLVSFGSYHIYVHHNIFYKSKDRTPRYSRRDRLYTTGPLEMDPIVDARYNIVWASHIGITSEDSSSNVAYNLFKFTDFPDSNFFSVDDNNPNGGASYVSQTYMQGNASVDNCINVNQGKNGVNFANNHSEFTTIVDGAVWPNRMGIILEWENTRNNAGPRPNEDNPNETEARSAIILPETTIWDEVWNTPTYTNISNSRSDVDNSSVTNTTDALLTLRNSLGLSMDGTAWQVGATTGDVDCSGTSNSTDALLILRYWDELV